MPTTHRQHPGARRSLLAPALIATAALLGACGSGAHGSSTATSASSSTVAPAGSAPTATSPAGGATAPAMSTSLPPWPLPAGALPYIRAAGLEALSSETLAVHYHVHLDIVVEGHAVTVPPGIGFVITNGQPTALSSLHTHDDTGVIHIESAVDKPFTLGQVFTEWGVKLDAGQMGGLRDGGGRELRLYVNGSRQSTAPQDLVLRAHQEIVLWYGPVGQQAGVPATYSFPPGE